MLLEEQEQERHESRITGNDLELHVDALCFDRDVVYKACYALTDRAWLWIEPKEGGFSVKITAKKDQNVRALSRELGNLLVDYALRKTIAQETQETRELLLRRALSGAGR